MRSVFGAGAVATPAQDPETTGAESGAGPVLDVEESAAAPAATRVIPARQGEVGTEVTICCITIQGRSTVGGSSY